MGGVVLTAMGGACCYLSFPLNPIHPPNLQLNGKQHEHEHSRNLWPLWRSSHDPETMGRNQPAHSFLRVLRSAGQTTSWSGPRYGGSAEAL